MKFKKNDNICMVKTYDAADEGMIGEIRGYKNSTKEYCVFFSEMLRGGYGHRCGGVIPEGGGHYIPEDYMELPMTFPQKLEKFKRERVGFHVDTKEIADELQKVFDKGKLKMHKDVTKRAWETFGNTGKLYVSYNYFNYPRVGFGLCNRTGVNLDEILPITLEELKEYNGHQQTTITITSDGYHRVTAESNGKTAEALCNPTDTFDLAEGAKLATQRLTEEEPKKADKLPKFSVGDTVEVINGGPNNTPVESKGMRGKVTLADSEYIRVRFDKPMSNSYVTITDFSYYPQDLKLVPKDEPMFHKGDLVEVIGESSHTKGSIGLQGVVMEDDAFPFVTLVTKVNGSNCWSYRQGNLKLIRRAND